MGNAVPYMAVFARIVVGLVFVFSAVGKLQDVSRFVRAVEGFQLLPRWLERPVALLVVVGEGLVAITMLVGGAALRPGFALGAILLAVFTATILSVLRRGLSTSCGCFGGSETRVSPLDVWRNIGFLACSVLGWLSSTPTSGGGLVPAEWAFLAVLSAVFVVLWIHLADLVQLLRPL